MTDTLIRARVCENCGKPLFFNHSQFTSSSEGWKEWHGGPDACRRAAEAIERLPELYDDTIQALVEIAEMLGRFTSEATDEEYSDVAKLQGLLLAAYAKASDGYAAERRLADVGLASDADRAGGPEHG